MIRIPLAGIFTEALEGFEGIFGVLIEGFEALGHLLVEGFETMGGAVAFGVFTTVNAVFAVFQALITAAAAVLPALPATIAPPEFVETMNWFFPIGTLVGIAGTLLTGYITWLGIRWIWAKFGQV